MLPTAVVDKIVTLELPEEHAKVLVSLLNKVGGDKDGVRGLIEDILQCLTDVNISDHQNFELESVSTHAVYIKGKLLKS